MIGMIDEDPNTIQPRYLQDLAVVSNEHDIAVYEDHDRGHRLIVLRPRLEEWLIQTARSEEIEMIQFGLSERGNDLHREINSRLPSLVKLIDQLLATNSARLRHLQSLLGLG